ncbi:MAG: hypothetical protein GX610_18730, partial [Rhodococcus sp.]|nr:hypothetical protein [Rhodococcus sp. (in: high G+C Gram-positive bacteria)]
MSHFDAAQVHDRLAEKSVNGNWRILTPLGAGLALVGLALFALALSGEGN